MNYIEKIGRNAKLPTHFLLQIELPNDDSSEIFAMNYRKDSKVLISRLNKCEIRGRKKVQHRRRRGKPATGELQYTSVRRKGSKDRLRRGYAKGYSKRIDAFQ